MLTHSQHKKPRWQRPQQLAGAELARVRRWLLDDGSLTARLIATGQRFSLQRLSQEWAQPRPDERRLLAMGARERALVRQVILRLDDQAVVYARSVFPVSSLDGPLLRLRRLQNESLGAFLFARADMRRSPFQIVQLSGDSTYLPPALRQQYAAWARRSCFEIAGKRMLVSEVFLEAFTPWPATTELHRSRRGQVSVTIRS